MNYRVHHVDVTEHLKSGVQPIVALNLQRESAIPNATTQSVVGGQFYVLPGPVQDGQRPTPVTGGELLRIPMVAYETAHALSALVGFGVQVGADALAKFAAAAGRPPDTIHLVLGHECHEIKDPQTNESRFRCYIGVAAHVRQT